MIQDSGNYVVQLFDKFSANMALLVIAICEFVSVSWIYGYERFSEDIRIMTGSKPGLWWKACWMVVSPCLILAILISSFVKMTTEPLLYNAWTRKGEMATLKYPTWAVFLGIAMTLVSVILIPLMAILRWFGIPQYTKEYPPPISSIEQAQQTLIVNGEVKPEDVNGNCQRNGTRRQIELDVETLL